MCERERKIQDYVCKRERMTLDIVSERGTGLCASEGQIVCVCVCA